MEKSSTIASRMAHFTKVCQERGLMSTHQRIEVFRELARAIDHPDVEPLFTRVRKRLPTVSPGSATPFGKMFFSTRVDRGVVSTAEPFFVKKGGLHE